MTPHDFIERKVNELIDSGQDYYYPDKIRVALTEAYEQGAREERIEKAIYGPSAINLAYQNGREQGRKELQAELRALLNIEL